MLWVIRAAALFLLYLGAFTYEDEQRRIQNRLEIWWIRVDDLQNRGLAAITSFNHVIAGLVTSMLDRIFGPRLISAQALAVSVALATASYCLESSVLGFLVVLKGGVPLPDSRIMRLAGSDLFKLHPELLPTGRLTEWIVGNLLMAEIAGILIALSLVRRPLRRRQVLSIYGIAAFVVVSVAVGYAKVLKPPDMIGTTVLQMVRLTSMLLLSWLLDLGCLIAFRYCLQLVPRLRSLWATCAVVTGSVGLAVGAVGVPLYFASPDDIMGGKPWYIVAVANIWNALFALVIVGLSSAMLLHQLVWPLVSRPLYAVATERLIAHRKILIGLGVSLLAASSPWFRGVAQAIRW